MKMLVLGASGMAGHIISLYFQEKDHEVITLTRKPFNIGKNINLDLNYRTIVELENIIESSEFDAIINCIGILNHDAERHKGSAVFLNSYLPHFLNEVTSKQKTKVIHMSTDCVFSGESGSYKEDSFKDGPTFYDRSKALGELNDDKNLTFRNSIIGPDINEDGIGLFNWFMKQEDKVKGYEKAIWTGVTTLTLAKAMESALKQNLTGIYNLVNNQVINKYEMLNLFNSIFRNDELTIEAVDHIKVDKSLVNSREDFQFIIPSYEEMFKEMKEWINTHNKYYPHYKKNF